MRRVYPVGAVLIVLLGLTASGCSGSKKITGSVTLNGQPLADARVEFCSKSNVRYPVADVRTDAQGHFEVPPRAKGKEALPPGQYVVYVRKPVDKKGNVPDDEEYGQLEAAGQLVNKAPPRYSDHNSPQLTVEVKPDTTTLPPFELKGQ